MDGAIGMFRKTGVVRYHADGGSAVMQLFEERHDSLAVARVEVTRRFVREQDRRLARESARDGDTLLLAARKLAGQMLGAVAHADALQRFEHETFPVARTHPAIGQRELDVLINGEIADQVKALEDESDLAIANARAIRE